MSIALALWLTLAPATPPKPVLQVQPPFPTQPKPKPAVPLAVTRVVRDGPPPYDRQERLYQIEGDGVDRLGLGEILYLHRPQEERVMPRLEVIVAMPDHVLARVDSESETYPMVGDLVWPRGVPDALPSLPGLVDVNVLPDVRPSAPGLRAPVPLGDAATHREPLYFLLGESRISPAGLAKLKAWVQAWGPGGKWYLDCPPFPGESVDISSARLVVLAQELKRLGVAQPEVRTPLDPATGKFPLVYIGADPW